MSARRSCLARLVGAVVVAAATLYAPPSAAAPTLWARALDPKAAERADLIAQADSILIRDELERRAKLRDLIDERDEGRSPLRLLEARALYELAGAATMRDPAVRLRYALLLQDLGEIKGATSHFEALLRSEPPAPIRADAWQQLAICYARLGRYPEEIKAYGEALALEPHAQMRALLFANRAEGHMVLGDLPAAIDGYRAALAALGSLDMFRYGVTTLWGLAVALDRSGDLDGAIEHIQLARTYDRSDRQINGPGWFYVPEYDEDWYAALGYWAAARSAELGAVRADSYHKAITAWESYIARAPATDLWLPMAKARLARSQKERDETLRRLLKSARPAGARR